MLNSIALMGRLTAAPELKHTPQNVAVCTFTLAVNRPRFKDKEAEADFIDIVAWRNTAEFVAKYFEKGQQVALNGRVQTRMWEDKQGNKRKTTEVVAQEVHFCGSRSSTEKVNLGGVDVAVTTDFDDGELPF